ncbi:polyprenyl synthetase family protein [Streptomyces sp. IBSNAI002]|uniref:polyprenyl synthetase family protein n=1 Tax=Streptomyces sp. IBSNAI002 TaxID=3457500 RepID=UPI003FD56E5E
MLPHVQGEAGPREGLDLTGIRGLVEACLADFLEVKARQAEAAGLPGEAADLLRAFLLAGGKRIRPVLCVAGWYAAGGRGDDAGVVRVAASLEMFHAFALIHDDIMDGSMLRRGRPTVHRALADRHGDARLGVNIAILIGSLALAWSDELVNGAVLAPGRRRAAAGLTDTMRTEVMYGQYLDLTTQNAFSSDVEGALRIARYKTASYTFERPLQIGAALAGADRELQADLGAFALPLGEAFQLRDDLLGVFGDPARTGKSAAEDLREGKQTALVALAMRSATPRQRRVLRQALGNPDLDEEGARGVRSVLVDTGAVAAVEDLIRVRRRQAEKALDRSGMSGPAARRLREFARSATERTS